MEVHKHASHATHKRRWPDYLLEFFMLFLAVFLGFVAENIREVYVEKHQEKAYMKSMIQDLTTDRNALKDHITQHFENIKYCDSLIQFFKNREFKRTADIYFFGMMLQQRSFFYLTDGTLQQLRNAGGFRLIGNTNIVDSIQSYQNLYTQLDQLQQVEESAVDHYRTAATRIFDVFIFDKMLQGPDIVRPEGNPELISITKGDINNMLMYVHNRKKILLVQLLKIKRLDTKAGIIIKMIKDSYSLKHE